MGKVGSMTVYDALRAADLDVPVEHVHALNYLDSYEANIRATVPDPIGALRVIRHGRDVRRMIDEGVWKGWNLISLVRAPIPRAISEFFYQLRWQIPDFEGRLAARELGTAELTARFCREYRDIAPLAFFNQQVRDLFGIDVYAEPFPKERGYHIYERGNVRLLILRLEDLDRCIARAMREYLGFPHFSAINRNAAEKMPYRELYKEFLAQLRLPPERVQEWHSSKYAQHFYTPEELARSAARWIEGSAPCPAAASARHRSLDNTDDTGA
jgi:hypothetical protein